MIALALVILAGAVLLGGAATVASATAPARVEAWTSHGLHIIAGPPEALGVVLGGRAPLGHQAVACGPMFDSTGPRFGLLDARRSVRWPTREPERGGWITVDGDRARGPRDFDPQGATVMVQGYPTLVVGGVVTATLRGDERTRRVALARLVGGDVALVGGAMGLPDFARALLAAGATDAVYLDGGRAAHLAGPAGVIYAHQADERPAAWLTLG